MTRYEIPITAKHTPTYDHPLDYIKLRLQNIPAELDQFPDRQAMLDRVKSASEFPGLGFAEYFRFQTITVIDEQTGLEKIRWARIQLTGRDALQDFESVDDRNLWYAPFISLSFSFPLTAI